MKLTKDQIETLNKYGASFRFRHNPPQFVYDKALKQPVPEGTGYCECIIIDEATKSDPETRGEYIRCKGPDEATAFAEAYAKIPTAPKPLTASQRMTADLVRAETDKALSDANAKIAELEAKLKAAQAAEADTPRSKTK